MAGRRKSSLHKRRRSRMAMVFLDETESEETYVRPRWDNQASYSHSHRWDAGMNGKRGNEFHEHLTSLGLVDNTGRLSDGELAGQVVGEIRRLSNYGMGCLKSTVRRVVDAFS